MPQPLHPKSTAVAVAGPRRAAGGSLWLRGALIVLATIVVYLPAMRGGFIFDDELYVRNNPLIKANDGLYRAWFTTEPPDYYPLTWSVWWLEWRAWGDRPMGYHVVNLLLHAVNAVLVWVMLRALRVRGAWLAGFVFAVHPVNVATAAYISEHKNTLSLLFCAVTVLFYLRFEREPHGRWYGFALVAFLLALLAKTAVVMLPVVLLGCVWWQRGRVGRKDLFYVTPFLALSLILGLITVWFQYHRVLRGGAGNTDSFIWRLVGAGWPPWFYLYKALLPFNLNFMYPKWNMRALGFISCLPGLAMAGCLALFWRYRASWGRGLLFGVGSFVVMLLPVLGLIDQGFYSFSLVADHWQYYSIVGIIALAVAAGTDLFCGPAGSARRYVGAVAATAALVVLGTATWRRANVYCDPETLTRDTLAKNPNAWLARYDLGNFLLQDGKVTDAIGAYEQVLQLNPAFVDAYNNLGNALLQAGKVEEAIRQYRQVLRLQPTNARAHYNLGNAWLQAGRAEEAIGQYEQALQISPDYAEAHYNLGNILFQQGRIADALRQFEQAVAAKPDYAEACYNLGVVLSQLGRVPEATKSFEQAVRLKPDYAEAHNNLGLALFQLGKIREAKQHYEEALRIASDYAEAHYNLGNLLLQLGDVTGASGHYEQALRRKPDYAEAHNSLGVALFQLGKRSEAKQQFEETLRLKPDYAEARSNLVALQSLPQTTNLQK